MIEIKIETDPAIFRCRAKAFLLENPSANQLIFDLAQRMESFSSLPSDHLMWLAEDDLGKIQGVALRTDPNHSLILSQMDDVVVDQIVDNARTIVGLDGVLAVKETAQLFREKWRKTSSKPLRDRMHLRLYDATAAIQPRSSAGRARVAFFEELDLLASWSYEFTKEALENARDDLAPYRKSMEMQINEGREWVWEIDGEVVAMAVWTGKNELGTKITGVYTPMRHRGRGFASNLVCKLTEKILTDGAPRAFIYTDLKNPTSNSIYQKIGYKHACDFVHFGLQCDL